MRVVPVVEAKAHFSALLAAAEAGEEIAITRRGQIIARLVPNASRNAAEVFREFWDEGDIDLAEQRDAPPAPMDAWD